ncbi:MAG TPA: DUF6452 family protein [Bacteroidales bacterium]|nr:DUF6452 family protein [Bacteroidales bacterium]
MRRPLKAFAVIIISGFYLLQSSCLDLSCIDETEAYVKAGFYSYSSYKPTIPDSLSLSGVNKDLFIYDKEKITPPVLIPLNDTTNNSLFVIKINGITDTIEFLYWSYPHLISKECGYSMFHTVDTIFYTKHSIDSISLINENITTSNVENISIYY